mmetsp:Transcript_35112/g.53855  ORF Transcript_35112/g.53855 Transcript_35112/m.53855 type:complete len:103 (-) Transcript_35112:720-1028(-)
MRRNDLKVMNKQLEKVIEHDAHIEKVHAELKDIADALADLDVFRDEITEFKEGMPAKIETIYNVIELNKKAFTDFKDDYFPTFMQTMKRQLVREVSLHVNKV